MDPLTRDQLADEVVARRDLADEVVRLRWRGNSTRVIAMVLGLEVSAVRELGRSVTGWTRAERAIDRTPLGPVAAGLVGSFRELADNRCRWIELDVDDDAARPCGQPCSTVLIASRWGGGSERRSPWCAEHHERVFPSELLEGRRWIF